MWGWILAGAATLLGGAIIAGIITYRMNNRPVTKKAVKATLYDMREEIRQKLENGDYSECNIGLPVGGYVSNIEQDYDETTVDVEVIDEDENSQTVRFVSDQGTTLGMQQKIIL